MNTFQLENAADLAVKVWYACATSPDNKFAMGVVDTPYNSYYFAARSNAFTKIAEWLIAEQGVEPFAAIVLSEEILATAADIGPEPVRQVLRHIQDQREQTIAEIQELLRPNWL